MSSPQTQMWFTPFGNSAITGTDTESLFGTDLVSETLIKWKISQKVNSALARG